MKKKNLYCAILLLLSPSSSSSSHSPTTALLPSLREKYERDPFSVLNVNRGGGEKREKQSAIPASNGAVLLRGFGTAFFDTALLLAIVSGMNKLPIGISILLSDIASIPEPKILGIQTAQFLAWICVTLPPNLFKYILRERFSGKTEILAPDFYDSIRPRWSPPAAWIWHGLRFCVAKPSQLFVIVSFWASIGDFPKPWTSITYFLAHAAFADAWNDVFFNDRRLGVGAIFSVISLGTLLTFFFRIAIVNVKVALLLLPSCVIYGWAFAMNLAVCVPANTSSLLKTSEVSGTSTVESSKNGVETSVKKEEVREERNDQFSELNNDSGTEMADSDAKD